MAQGGSQGTGGGAQQAQELCRGHRKSHLLSASLIPEPGEGRDQQTGCVTEWVGSHLSRMRVPSAFLPGAHPHGKVGRQKLSPRTIWGSMSQSLPWWRDLLLEGSPIQEPAGMAPPPCLSGPPHVGPRQGLWGQRTRACLCCVFSLETSPASAPHPPWGT